MATCPHYIPRQFWTRCPHEDGVDNGLEFRDHPEVRVEPHTVYTGSPATVGVAAHNASVILILWNPNTLSVAVVHCQDFNDDVSINACIKLMASWDKFFVYLWCKDHPKSIQQCARTLEALLKYEDKMFVHIICAGSFLTNLTLRTNDGAWSSVRWRRLFTSFKVSSGLSGIAGYHWEETGPPIDRRVWKTTTQ